MLIIDLNLFKFPYFSFIGNLGNSKKSFVYDFLSSMRQKVNDPLGIRTKKRKKIRQQ